MIVLYDKIVLRKILEHCHERTTNCETFTFEESEDTARGKPKRYEGRDVMYMRVNLREGVVFIFDDDGDLLEVESFNEEDWEAEP